MKKTIIALLALAGVAAAETQIISNANNTASTDGDWFASVAAAAEINSTNTNTFTATGYTNDFYSVSTNVGSGGSYTYTLTFSLKEDIVLSSLKVDFFLHDSQGKSQAAYDLTNVNRKVSYALTLGTADADPLFSADETSLTTWSGTNNNNYNYDLTSAYDSETDSGFTTNAQACTINLATGDIALSKGTEYSLTIDVAQGTATTGTFVGIGNIQMTAVPEPTAATLSLLALAGLAARRRRK